MPVELTVEQLSSPIGGVTLVSDRRALCALDFEGYEERVRRLLEMRFGRVTLKPGPRVTDFPRRLEDYFSGDLAAIEELPVAAEGTQFQCRVWAALRTIPAGATLTYQQLAARIGRPTASRAVGMANSQNPVAIVQPCHRVIGAGGQLTGYAGGLDRKRWLLAHEAAFSLVRSARA